MKKKEKYYAVNNQEDEDGFTLYPGNAIIENVKGKPDINSRNDTANSEQSKTKDEEVDSEIDEVLK
jgi:hypothetical protein